MRDCPASPESQPYLAYSVRLLNTCLATDIALEKFLLPLLLNDILAGVVPVEVADGLLAGRRSVSSCWGQLWPNSSLPRSHLDGSQLTCSRRR